MITLDELLIKIGVDGAQAQKISGYVDLLQTGADKIGESASAINEKLDGLLDEVSGSLDSASKTADKASKDITKTGDSAEKAGSKFSKLKLAIAASVGALMLLGNKIASAFNNAIDNAKTLFQSKNALYQISEDEISQVDRYKQSLERTSLSIDSVKTKIAINLIPTLTAVSEKFNGWLMINKDFITNGITKTVEWIGKGIQVVINFIKFIDKVISSTIGWKNAFIALGVAWAVLNRAFLFSPVGMIITAFGVLLLLIDDLMVYMRGGKSLFGTYWDPLIKGGKAVIKFFQESEAIWKPILVGLLAIFAALSAQKMFLAIVNNIKMVATAFRALTMIMMTNPIIAILTAIALLAYYVYKNWDTVKEKFKEIWGKISQWTEDAFNAIANAVRDATRKVLMWFGFTEDEAEQMTESMKDTFELVFGFITSPFERAFKFVKDLFKIWGDDTKTTTQKFKDTFRAVYEYVISPFRDAMKWIEDKFNSFIDATVGNAVKLLNKIPGFNIEYGEEATRADTSSAPSVAMLAHQAVMASTPQVPSPTSNSTVNNDVKLETKIDIHTNDSVEGAKRASDYLADQINRASDYTKSAVRG